MRAMTRISPLWTVFNDFHIEKVRLPVTVVTTSGEGLAGELFVQASPRHPGGHEPAADLVNSGDPFLPLATTAGRVLLVAKAHVREVHLPGGADDPDPALEIGTPADVALSLVGRGRLRGTVLIDLESARQRVLDWLNRPGQRFIRVRTPEGSVLVNREHIVHLEHLVHREPST